MTDHTPFEAIPKPPGHPVIGNLLDIRGDAPLLNMIELAKVYGPIFRLELGGRSVIILSGFELVDEVCDHERFDKFLGPGLLQARTIAGDGLFTAWTHEPNWKKAHNILTPSFGAMAVRSYLPEMGDIAMQLVDKWSRLNPAEDVDVAADMTRLTLDTIGLCAFSYRFNSFYGEEPPPFVQAMLEALAFATANISRLPIQRKLHFRAMRRLQENVSTMNGLVDRLIAERQADPNRDRYADLLHAMLVGVDRQSGETLNLVNIRYQILTFLIAGHETTSGLLTFALYYLLHNPEVLAKAYAEVDEVMGGDLSSPPSQDQVRQMRYVGQILSETLRIWPTAPAFTRHAFEKTTIGGKYEVSPEDSLLVLIPMLHRDKAIWGPDPESFDPSRFDPEAVASRPANAYKPFGTGFRACIGRYFALQEAVLALAMILQRFELVDHMGYELRLRQTLTIKPVGFRIKVRPRDARPAVPVRAAAAAPPETETEAAAPAKMRARAPLLVLFGSNTGTCETIAHRIAEDSTARGYSSRVEELDARAESLPGDGAVVIVTASYNGTPTDNAAKFVAWLEGGSIAPGALSGVRYTVFGCGDKDWADTFQRIPRLIDAKLEQLGAERIYPRGEGDQSDDIDTQFRDWYGGLFDSLAAALHVATVDTAELVKGHRYELELLTATAEPETLVSEFGARPLAVIENRELQTKDGPRPSDRSTRHVVFSLPEGLTYLEGDHLGVLPRNSAEQVGRVLKRFAFPEDSQVRIRMNGGGKAFLPVDRPVPIRLLLSGYLAIQDPARRSDIEVLVNYAESPSEKAELAALSGEDPESLARYREEVLARNRSVIDLLEDFPSCRLPFNLFIELVPLLRPRYFSISSSPLVSPSAASITVGVVKGAARSGHGTYCGVASGYLAGLANGTEVECFIRPPSIPFFPPDDAMRPMIMIGAGTGIAPFRGFLETRAAKKSSGESVGPAVLFHGCRNRDQDHIYADEFEAMARAGVVELQMAYSRPDDGMKCYVQDRLAQCGDRLWDLIDQGANVYVCGDAGTMAPAVERAFIEICGAKLGIDADAAGKWLAAMKSEKRYLVDIWPR
ncbi:NADPH--cytochrome P450 reductase [Mesorhizobium sp. L-8-10]|nr:NADPH--cytochrome P450 reductase [Mesorhizobium sp. L-8-10]